MADLKILAQTTGKQRVGNGVMVSATGTRDGALYVADYILGMAIEGKVFHAQLGSATTPVTFRVGLTALQPEFVIDVPSGTTIIPIHLGVYLEAAAGTVTEIVAEVSQALRGSGTSTAGTIMSTRSSRANSSSCLFYYTYSGNAVAASNPLEFWRDGFAIAQAAGVPAKFRYDVQQQTPQVIDGPGALSIYIDGTGTAPTGYIKASWIELPTTAL